MKMSAKHIVVAIPCLNRGGTEMQTLNLVRALSQAGYKLTTVCYFENDAEVVAEFRAAGTEVILMQCQRNIGALQLISKLKALFKRLNPDIVHVQYMAPGALPIVAARLAGVNKVLATVHQPYTQSHGAKAKWLLRMSALLCTRFICVSQNAEKSWFGSGALYNESEKLNKQNRHFTIYNAVDVTQIQQIKAASNAGQLRKGMGLAAESKVIGAVSRLTFEKGIDILIQALAQAIQKEPLLHLLIVGTGAEEATLKKLAVRLAVDKNITFYGKSDWQHAMELMSVMDVVVVPSRFEGFGLTAAEAMAMGKPVIASDVFGLKELITEKVSGLMFKNEDFLALSEQLIYLMQQPEVCTGLGENGYNKCVGNFDTLNFNKQISALYSAL